MKGWGPKSSACPSKLRENKLFGGISRDFAGISRCQKFQKEKTFVFDFWPLAEGIQMREKTGVSLT